MKAVAFLLILAVMAGCSQTDVRDPPSAPAPAPPMVGAPALRVDCTACFLQYEGMTSPHAHLLAADPYQAGRVAIAFSYLPPIDPNHPAAYIPPNINVEAVAVSEDGGHTWFTSAFPADPGDGQPGFAGLAWAPDGSLWAAPEMQQLYEPVVGGTAVGLATAGPVRAYRSTDAGRSWSESTTFGPNGAGYASVTALHGSVYVAWSGVQGSEVAWTDDSTTWTGTVAGPSCFTMGDILPTVEGLMSSCVYQFGAGQSPTTALRLDRERASLTVSGPDLPCPSGGPALAPNGTMVLATVCTDIEFWSFQNETWSSLGSLPSPGAYEQSPLGLDASGTMHVIYSANAAAGESNDAIHAWRLPDGTVASAKLGGTLPSNAGAYTTPTANPWISRGAEGLWFMAQVEDGVLVSRLVP